MLTELTQEQKDLIPIISEKWINIALHQPTRNAEIVTKNVRSLYAMSGLQEPNVILCTLSEFCDYFKNTAVYSAVYSAVDSAVRSAVRSAVDSAVRSAVRSAVYSAVDSAVRSAVYSAVDSAVYWRADDIAYAEYFVNIGTVSGDISDNLQKYADILQDFGYAIYTKETAYLLVKPRLHLNEQGLPHNTRGLAIAWEDGSGIYALNGVIFPKELYEKVTSGNMPFADILAIEDIDQRTQAMRFGNVWDFIKYQNATLIDSHTKDRQDGTPVRYWLYRFPKGDIFTDDVDYMIYDDLVPGSIKQYMSGVPTSNTVAEAMAWKHQTTPGYWAIMQPGIDMN